MTRVLLLSDTHSYIDDRILYYAAEADEVWHAGDVGDKKVTDALAKVSLLRAVYGNIDDQSIRECYPLNNRFLCEKVAVWITHIGGYPPNYNNIVRSELMKNTPKLFVTGHSHILKVMNDKNLGLLHINPGAAGKYGFHKIRTMVQFNINEDRILDLNVIELGTNG